MKLKQFIFALAVMLSGFAISVNAQEAKIGTTTYGTLAEAVEAAAAGDEIVLLKNVTLQGGYDADPTAGLRIEKALTINGNKKTIDCGSFEHGIRVYITGSSKADVKFENVTIKNNNPYGRCIDMRTGKIALEVKSGAKLIAQGVNSQPLTIGGSSATYRVRVSNATIDAGETGYGIISFVRVTNNIEFSSSVKISGLAALYLKEGANNTTVTMGNGTYTGTNLNSAASGMFGAVVIEGKNNTITVNHEKAVIKAVAGNDANQAVQAAFLLKEGATGNKIQVTNANAQVLTEGAQAQWAVVASDATNNVLINKGQTVNFAVECGGYLYMDANKAFSMVIPQEKEATTVKLLSDVTLDNIWTVAAGQDITLDLNGKTINVAYAEGSTTNHIYAIDNKGTLKITGNGTINARGIFNYGAMTLENGTINAIDGNGGYAVRNYAGSLTMNGGTIATTLEDDHQVNNGGYDATTVRVDEGATFTMNGGELNNICDYTFAIENHGTTTVKGGKATSVHTTVANYGTINIEGGEFVCNGLEGITAHAVWAAEGTTNISGGTFNGKDNFNGFNVDASEGAEVNITGGTFLSVHSGSLYGEGTIAVSGGTFFDAVPEKYCAKGYAPIELGNGTYGVQEGQIVALIGSAKYFSLADALAAAKDGETISLQWRDDYTPIAMNGSLYGKSVTITGTAKVDWSKGFLFVARGGEGDATLTFDNANLTSASNQATYGIHVSGRQKNTTDKYDGTLVIKNSTIELDYLINKGAMTLDNSSLTVKNGFDLNGRPASETENGEDANATLALTNGSKLVVNNHNGMGIGREGKGELTVDASSTFEHTQDFLVCANGTMDVKGTLVSNGKKLTNNGEVKFTATKLTDATIEGTGTTRFYNDVNFYGANSITTTGINGTPFHLVVNEGANLFITRFVLGYDRNITVNGTIADASAFNPEGQTPSLKFNSASGVSVGGTGTGNLQVKNAYIELGNSSWKNAQGTYDWDFVNSYVSAVSFTNATGADAATWDVTFNKSILDAKNYIKNGKNVTYNFTNNSRGTTGSLRIDGELNIDATSSVVTTSQQNNKVGAVDEHGGINGTVNVAGNLTIGSNSKTQLEVLGGTVNVVAGATLDLGDKTTMTLDAASAMQSAGNISGAITAADGANVAITGGTYTQDVNEWCTEGFVAKPNADGSFGVEELPIVAKVGDKEFYTVQKALQYAIDNSAAEVVVLTDVREKMVTDFDLVIKANLTIKAADKFTAEAPAKVEFYNEGTSMDFAVGTADGAERCTLTIAENVHFDLVDRVIWLGYYGNNVDVVVNGYFGGYQIWHGANTTVNNGGMLDSHGEAFIMRRDATLTAKEGSKVKANYFQIYSGHINATGADITAGLVWVNNNHSYGSEGTVSFTLNKTTFTSNGEVKMYPGADKRIPVTVSNDSHFAAKGAMTLDNSVDVTVDATSSITYNNGQAFKLPVATINGLKYTSLQDAVNAVKNGETIVLVDVVTENVTLTEKVDLYYTIDGAGQQFKGSISVNSLSDTNDNRRITIKNIKFVDDSAAKVDFITSVNTNHYPRLTVEGCTFTGSRDATDVALRLKSSHSVVITNCTGTGLHSFLQNTSGWNLTIDNVKVTESKGAFALGTVQGVTIKGSTIDVATYGIRLDANTYNNNAAIEGNNVTAFIPVVVRSVNTQSNVTFTGENTFTAENTDGKWMVIGTTEYEEGVALPAEVTTGNVVVALNGTNLSYDGVHGAGLAGKGTAEAPYLINNVAELEIFRNSVNAGSAKYSKPGLCVALGADIDMTGVNWVGIGTATADHGFMGNFDGKNFKIKNLTITNPALDSDGYAYAGLFGVTEGTDKDNQNTIKNLTIENVTINTTGHIAAAAIAYPYYTIVDNVKVCGDIAITGGNYTAGVLAYTRRCVKASNLSIIGENNSFVKGAQVVGGVISDIQMNGGLKAEYSNFSAKNIAVIGEQMVGGISGNIATQTLNGATVENVTLTSGDARVGTVAGCFGGTSTITDVTVNNVTGATAVIGATYNGAKAVETRIGDTYYETFAAAYTAAQAGETVTMLADLNMSEILVLDKAITLDGNGKTLTSTAGRAINVDCDGNVAIKNLTIDAKGERAINVIQKPANVTIDNVTATAANYTVNVAASAPNAVVAISNSNLTGLNVVNVTAPGAEVTINGGTITCNDQTDAECYAALNLTKDAKNGKIVADNVTFDIKGDSKKASNGAEGGVITIDGKADEVDVIVAYISYGNNYYSYTSIEAAIAKAKDGETIGLLRDVKASDIITINKAITLDGNGKTLTSTAGRAINVSGADGVTIKNLTIDASGERAINVIQNATNVTIEKVVATAANYTVNVAASAPNAVVAINNSTLNGLCTVNVSAAGANVTVDHSTVNCNDNNTTAGEAYAALSLNKEAVGGSIVATNSTINVAAGSDSKKGRNSAENGTVTINGSTDGVAVMVAVITYEGSVYYHSFSSLAEAVEFAKAGDVITLIRDVTVAQPVVINKSVTLDGNGKTLTYTGTDRAIEMPNVADADYDVTVKNLNVVATTANRGLNYNDNGKLNVEGVTVTIGENVDGYAINFPGMADGAQVTIKDSKLTSRNPLNIWGENMTINVHNSEIISVDNSTTYDYAAIQLNNDNYGNVANGTVVNVYGGTITALNDNGEPSNVVANATETGVVNISDETVVTGKVLDYVANIGGVYFGSLQAAVNAIEKHGYNSPIVIMKNFATSEATTIKSGLKVTINLNGKTITGTDNATGSYGLININPDAELTINGNGAITLIATNNREWNAYSSVISNQRGKLTVNGGTIEHLGGTDMAYAIDNLTNGKGTKAETIINGGTVKSTYRAIRQFLNGTEAQNILTVNGGTIEGANKSIWMQDANKSANPGALTVAKDAELVGDVYLFVTAGSTEWPVSVSIAADALQGESKVVTGNVPAGYDVANVDGIYGIYSGAAKIGTTYYETIEAAIKAAKAGETVNILAGTYKVPSMKAGITVEGAVNADGTPAVLLEGTLSNTLENLTLKNLHIKGGNAQRWAYAKGNLVFENVIFDATSVYAIHFDDIAAGTNLTYKNCTIIGWAAMGGTPESCVFDGCTIKGNGSYGVIRTYFDAEIKDCTFDVSNVNTNDVYQDGIHAVDGAEVVVAECTNVNGTMKDLVNISDTSEVTVDGVVYKNVAKVGDKNYITIEDAFAAWADGTTLTLLTDITLNTKTLATQNDGYATIVNVAGKAVTLDLNGKNITVDAAAADLANANGKMLLAVFSADLGGHLTLTDNSDAKNGAVTLNVNDAKVYSMFASESGQSDKSNSGKITVNGGNYTTVGKVSNAMFFADANEVITVNGGNFHCDGASTTANYPWMFNTVGNNELHVTVNGGTFNVDINHQHRPFEVKVPETLAVKANDNGTWTVVPAEAYITEMLGGTVNEAGEWGHKVGYATIAEAVAAVEDGQTITLVKDITYTKDNASVSGEYFDGLVYTGDKSFTIDFNGKTITENGDINDYLVYLKNAGEKDNEITFKNGTIAINSESRNTAWAAITVGANSATHKTTLNLDGMKVVNGNPNDANNQVIRVRKGSVVNLNEGTVVTSNGTSYGVVAETTATVNINKGAKVVQTNSKTTGGNQVYTAVSGNGTINVYDGAEIVSDNYGIHNLTTGNAVINIYGGTIEAKVAVKASTNGAADQSATVTIEGGNFKGALENYTDAATIVVKGGTFDAAVDTKYVATGYICKDNLDGTFGVIVDPKYGKVAQIIRNDYYAENQYFATINEAVQAAVSGETVTLIADVETSAAKLATIGEENYAVIVAVKEKDITLDLNGKSVTVNPTAEELANAEGKMLMSVFGMDTNGKLTLTGNGSVKVNANGANVYSLVAAYGEGSAVVIENGNYAADAVMASGSLIYSHEMITVMGGTFKLDNLATGANGSPWIFNTIGQNYTGVKVVGGTYPTDINHQFWANEVLVPEEFALQANSDGTWTVVPAVAYTNEKATSRNASWRHVGYASLEDAIAATGKYNCQGNTVTMIEDITLEPITVANGVKVAIDLNGKTISGTDNGTASYGLINNKGELTINGTGAITLKATQDRGWAAYSSVISNQVGGKLTVNGGTIQHLGGTSMAWGIDNLTNGKGTYAETVINGGVVKSKYIAIRQFLNGVEADNILTVNGGTLEGETASLYFQDPSKNANTGTLNVLDGTLAGDVYLDVTAGSTEWPVEVYIAKAALSQNDIHADNVPAEAAALVEYDTFWQVEQKNLAELTIKDACEEYINKIEKNVVELTYERYFDDTEWQTIVLPFDVPVANLMEQFEVAYIYNASYEGKQATIKYVVIDENSPIETLRANYPYMIRAKEEGWNNIVVENAKLMPTKVEILDCSSIFEKFSFIGSYATVDTDELDAKYGYFNLTSGAWSKKGIVNPFRFYMQIELRNGKAFEYPASNESIRMRRVDENGNADTTGIDGVEAENAGDFIFDLHGRRVLEPLKGGLYIINGKKVIF